MPSRAAFRAMDAVDRMRFRRAPLAGAAVAFALGVGFARRSPQFAVVLCAGLVLLAALSLLALRFGPRVGWVPVLGVWVVLGMAAEVWQPQPPVSLRLLSFADGLSRTVRGRVLGVRAGVGNGGSEAEADGVPAWEAAEDTSAERGRPVTLDLEVEAVEDVTPDTSRMVAVPGGVRVQVYGVAPVLGCGDEVEMPLRLRAPVRYGDPGVFQSADYLAGQGIGAETSVAGEKVVRTGAGAGSWACRLRAAQGWASGRMRGFGESRANRSLPGAMRLSAADGAMLNAMLFGDRGGLSHELRAGFERTGTFHLFVVSGLHVALLAGALWWVLRRLRVPEWPATGLTLVMTTAYAALTGFGQPAQRSLAMTAIVLAARLLSRDRDVLNALGAAALAMLVWSPRSLFEASFQMSVLAIVAIGGIAVPLGERTFVRYIRVARGVFRRRGRVTPAEGQFRLMLELWGEAVAALLGRRARKLPARMVQAALWVMELALIGLVVELVMVLPMAMYFHRATVMSMPANLLVVPLIAVLAPAGVMLFAGTLVSPWVAAVPGAATALLLHGVRLGIHTASRVRGADLRVPGPVWWVALLAVAGWMVCTWAVRRSGWGALFAAALLPVIAAAVLWPERVERTPGVLEVTAIDVGQGDSLLAVGPGGQTMLIDAGGPIGSHGQSEVVAGFDVGEEVVSPYLWTRRLRRLDVVVLTHAHTDHMGGMPAVLENFRPRELWVSAGESAVDSPLFAALLRKAAELGIAVRFLRAGDAPAWGVMELRVLAPEAGYANAADPRNDDSLVLEMDWGKASVLLEGDAERPSEDAMLAAGALHPVTLLKVGHHGSRTSSNPEFLAAVRPRVAVVSVGRRNTFGHPRPEVIARFANAGTRLFRTDRFGLTTFLLSEDGSEREVVNGVALGR